MKETLTFGFSGDEIGMYRLQFEVLDDWVVLQTSDLIEIEINRSPNCKGRPYVYVRPTVTWLDSKTKFLISGTASDSRHIEYVEYRRMGDDLWKSVQGFENWSIILNMSELSGEKTIFQFRAFDGEFYSNIDSITIDNSEEDDSFLQEFGLVSMLGAIFCVIIFHTRRRSDR